MVKVGVVGATGYTGEEIVSALLRNPGVEITALTGLVEKEALFSELYPRFAKKISLVCRNLDVEDVAAKTDLVFLALPHTVSMKMAPQFLEKGKKVIDLSADYRLPPEVYKEWYKEEHSDKGNIEKAVYGLPELNRSKIKKALLIANPGCYPTSVILPLLPIMEKVVQAGSAVIVDSKTGATGAGRKASVALSFGEIDENLKCYKANEHQHMPEMEHILSVASGKDVKINFVPHLLPVKRGIMSTIYIPHKDLPDINDLHKLFADYYKDEPFVRIAQPGYMPQLLDVVETNFCDIGIKSAGGMLIIVSVIDNLMKGASGQAVQNMNIMLGVDETARLV